MEFLYDMIEYELRHGNAKKVTVEELPMELTKNQSAISHFVILPDGYGVILYNKKLKETEM